MGFKMKETGKKKKQKKEKKNATDDFLKPSVNCM